MPDYKFRSEEGGIVAILECIKYVRRRRGKSAEFRPGSFLDHVEDFVAIGRRRPLSRSTIKTTYYRSKKNGYYDFDERGWPQLTHKGEKRLAIYKPTELTGAYLMVIFDIEERQRHKRDRLRRLLKSLKFKQVQKSVWISKYDTRKVLEKEIKNLKLGRSVQVYESLELRLS